MEYCWTEKAQRVNAKDARRIEEAFKEFGGDKGHLTRHELKCAAVGILGTKPLKVRSPNVATIVCYMFLL